MSDKRADLHPGRREAAGRVSGVSGERHAPGSGEDGRGEGERGQGGGEGAGETRGVSRQGLSAPEYQAGGVEGGRGEEALEEEAASLQGQGDQKPGEVAREVDRFVADCIRQRRRELGMNQREFGQRVGVSLQQVHKYERQLNRVSAGRLFVIARVLRVPIQYFFASAGEADQEVEGLVDAGQAQLLRQCGLLRNPAHQRAVASLCQLLMDAERQSGKR